jgi:hypothetical protein
LKLPHGISVEPAVNAEANGSANLDSAPNVQEVQFFIARAQVAAAQKLIGHLITADGTLNESLTASQYTKVWLDVKTLAKTLAAKNFLQAARLWWATSCRIVKMRLSDFTSAWSSLEKGCPQTPHETR